jgi:hypothetical protein
MQNRVNRRSIKDELMQQVSNAYHEVAMSRSHYSAAHWYKMTDRYREEMKRIHTSNQLRDYYENEARLCDAEAKRIEEQKFDR